MQKQYSLVLFFIYSLTLCSLIQLPAQHDTTQANLLLDKGLDLYYDGDYLEARPLLQKALDFRLRYYPINHIKIEDMYYWLGVNEQDLRNNEQALFYYQKGLEIAESREGAESVVVADFYMEMGNTYDQAYRIDEAKACYEKTLAIYRKEFGDESSEVGNTLMNIGYGQRKMGNYHTAGTYYKAAFENFKKSSKPTSKDFYRIYINQCNLLIDLGVYDRAMDFAEKALEIKLMHYDTLHPSVYKYYGNIGRIYQLQNKPEQALPYAQKALTIAEITRGKEHPETAGLLGELATVYEDLGQLDKALRLQLESVEIQEKGLSPTHPYLIAGYESIGGLYKKNKAYNQALTFYQTALEKYQDAPFVPKHLLANTLGSIAEILSLKGEEKEALKIIRNGIQNIVPDFQPAQNDIYVNPSLSKVEAEGTLLELLRDKSFYIQACYKKDGDLATLKQAFQTSRLAIQLIEKIRRSYQSEEAQQRLNTETLPVFEQAVEQAYLLYQTSEDQAYLRAAFELSEKSKASILQQSMNAQKALGMANVSKELTDTIQSLELRISQLEEQLFNALSEEEFRAITSEVFELKIRFEEEIVGLEKHSPAYYQLKYASSTIDINEWMKILAQRKASLVEYFYTEKHLYIFVLNDKGLQLERLEQSIDLRSTINTLRNARSADISELQKESGVYLSKLKGLYQLLIEPVRANLTAPNLIIVPHGLLNYLSFDALVSEGNELDFRKLNYLIQDYNIQYHWSAELWAKTSRTKSRDKYSFIGFAPSFNAPDQKGQVQLALRYSPNALQYAVPEIEGAHKYFPGQLFIGAQANESIFNKLAPNNQIIHLATHAQVNDLQPLQSGLLFSEEGDTLEDGYLNALEIYQMQLDAELAVMSACNTGFGQLIKGEGIMSLGRAFLYAGCNSLVTSLWLANDASTSKIIQNFYDYLAQGMTKDEALRMAKIDYLKTADPLTAHPYFWANLIAIGDMSPLSKKSLPWHWILLASLMLMLIGYYLAKR